MSDDSTCHSRGPQWLALFAFSIVALTALLTEVGVPMSDEFTDYAQATKWSEAAISMSLAFSGLAVLAHILRKDKFVGTVMEGGLSFLLLIFWAAVIPVLNTPDNDLAVTGDGLPDPLFGIKNPNLYFFSWLSFIVTLLILSNYLRNAHNVGVSDDNAEFSPELCAGLCMAGFVVMGAAIRLYEIDATCGGDSFVTTNAYCKRTKFAIALGLISALLSLAWMVLGAAVSAMVNAAMSVVLLIAWIFGIIYLTFGGISNAPGGIIGNLYFATWISFVITVVAAAKDVGRVLDQKKNDAATATATEGAVEGSSGAGDSPTTPANKDEEKGKAEAEEMGQEEMTHPEEMHE